LGTTPLNVLMHIKHGWLLGKENDSGWQVGSASLAALICKREAGEAPSVCQSGCGKAHGCKSCGE
jgi:hypothetical protein